MGAAGHCGRSLLVLVKTQGFQSPARRTQRNPWASSVLCSARLAAPTPSYRKIRERGKTEKEHQRDARRGTVVDVARFVLLVVGKVASAVFVGLREVGAPGAPLRTLRPRRTRPRRLKRKKGKEDSGEEKKIPVSLEPGRAAEATQKATPRRNASASLLGSTPVAFFLFSLLLLRLASFSCLSVGRCPRSGSGGAEHRICPRVSLCSPGRTLKTLCFY